MLKFILFLLFAIILLLVNYFFDFMSHLSPDAIQEWLLVSGRSAPLVYMSIMAVDNVVSPIPSQPLDIAAGVFFGPLQGTLYSAFGALAGAMVSFFIARFLGREMVEKILRDMLTSAPPVLTGY
jgi:uncharacterized membrane protein YdjX (TVP38/TMEM64 family)